MMVLKVSWCGIISKVLSPPCGGQRGRGTAESNERRKEVVTSGPRPRRTTPRRARDTFPRRREDRVTSDCHFRKTATEYDRKTGIKWSSCTEK
jgi:hypothetical protein